jgi:spore germination protein YaaH
MNWTSTHRFKSAALVVGLAMQARAQKLEALWYSTGNERSTQSFLAHADKISIVSPQVFFFDSTGALRGRIDPRLVAKAREQGVKIVPLVMNPGFDQPMIHHLITNPEARAKSIESMVALCRDNKFDGIQFDVENVHVKYKNEFTSWVRETAERLHRVSCSASAAVVPRFTDDRGPTSYHQWIFDNWRGVYDYKALADALDFISFMTYAQHTGGSPPGPVAGYTWMEDCLKYVLSLGVPPNKISLGVPAYSDWWYPVYSDKEGARMRGNDVSYTAVMDTLATRGVKPLWDDREKTLYAIWSHAGVNELAWIEDARAFSEKVDLARRYKLRGYSVWVLGLEDPAVWK